MFFLASVLYAQDYDSGKISSSDESLTVYIIRELEFNITGRTKPHYLILNGEFREGERLQGSANLERYVERKTQLLNNQRVLDDTATVIQPFFGEPENDGAIPVRLEITVKDSFNLVLLPYPQFDTNEGFSVTLKARDYNFLGRMSPLRLDLGYKNQEEKHSVFFMLDSDLPFQAFGLDWNFNFDYLLGLTFTEPLYYRNVTGLSVQIPSNTNIITTVGINQYLTFNEKADNVYYDPYGSTEFFTFLKIPFGFEIADFGQLSYIPKIQGIIHYPNTEMAADYKPSITFSQSLGFGRNDWTGNLRKGLSASIENSNTWYVNRSDSPLKINLDVNAAFHWPFNSIIGFTSRLKYRQQWHWSKQENDWLPIEKAGDVLRGIPDNDLQVNYMLSINLDLPVRVLRFWPSEWFDNPGLEFLNFEVYFSPFLDLALVQGSYFESYKDGISQGIKFSLDGMIKNTGLEIIIYPAVIRSLLIRGSVGYNIDKVRKEGLPLIWGFFSQWHEIYLGVDLYY